MKVLSLIMYLLLSFFYITVFFYAKKNFKKINLRDVFYAEWEEEE